MKLFRTKPLDDALTLKKTFPADSSGHFLHRGGVIGSKTRDDDLNRHLPSLEKPQLKPTNDVQHFCSFFHPVTYSLLHLLPKVSGLEHSDGALYERRKALRSMIAADQATLDTLTG
ncbi:unnamed protein product [Nezara viridula]|uniref:Uncharacterized protein n=1 Tax=Nezara viridula TaxID=85310 RepID=A0A9P0MTF3_NEZVI|nr:unnamed protein product [Nezara viridula]